MKIHVVRNGKPSLFDTDTGEFVDGDADSGAPSAGAESLGRIGGFPTTMGAQFQFNAPNPDLIGFNWKGTFRELAVSPARRAVLDSAPNPEFARWLLDLLIRLRVLPAAPDCTYRQAMSKLGLRDMKEVFQPLKDVQQWCGREGLFDLSALIVKNSGEPGSGHYGSDCLGQRDWKEYCKAALQALDEARRGRRLAP
jgi:hypothetical protein